ncbi:AAA family ATPase [Limimaricola sp. G21655-S1]|uniref:AAA family ATPase n=1 Tax=Limimaricola sp. G21655-S1 TaxID=3014768 RepID=UPI0022AFB75F|nr:ATP-binding protein [Limimaricola sp. G21655-S1]MCZ4260137.1 AAA family ATPase [Limimaricola sp. G21655-S1]
MHIQTISVEGLFGKSDVVELNFNKDLNIVTGRNGSGKTTLLKLAWFVMSGNILHALREVEFKSFHMVTSDYSCHVVRTGPLHCRIEMEHDGQVHSFEDDQGDPAEDPFFESAEDKANPILASLGRTVFFPTFRRIEGGFSMDTTRKPRSRNALRAESEIDEALSSLSKRLGSEDHVFVSAISTQDIVQLLLRRYASFSEEINAFQADVSRSVIDKIKRYEEIDSDRKDANSLLSETRTDIESIETFRRETMRPLDAVRGLVERLFQHSGISFGTRLSFGDAAAAVNSNALSAGEKQMLSFICYNAFYKNAVIFIDEPELSLHVDWQRQLFSILEGQKSENQFVFATHSPFIYAKYPDKEIAVNLDRGE